MAERALRVNEAKILPKAQLDPCNSCDLDPATCGKQMGPYPAGKKEVLICGIGRGYIVQISESSIKELAQLQ